MSCHVYVIPNETLKETAPEIETIKREALAAPSAFEAAASEARPARRNNFHQDRARSV
jgi:hypothetical protein